MIGPAGKRLAPAVVKAVDMAHTVHERLDASSTSRVAASSLALD